MILQFTSRGWRGQIKPQVARLGLKDNEREWLDTILWGLFDFLCNTGSTSYIDPEHWKPWLMEVTGGRLLIDAEIWNLVMSTDDHLYAVREGSFILTTVDREGENDEVLRRSQVSAPLRRFLTSLLVSQKTQKPYVVDDTTWTIVETHLSKGVAIDLIPYMVKHRYDRVIVLVPFGKPWIEWTRIKAAQGRKMCPYCETVLVTVEYDTWQICGVKDDCRRTAHGEIITKLGL